MKVDGYDEVLKVARTFVKSDLPKMELYLNDNQVNDVAATPLSANCCIKVTIEYSDLPVNNESKTCFHHPV
jgi:hypothetical protein